MMTMFFTLLLVVIFSSVVVSAQNPQAYAGGWTINPVEIKPELNWNDWRSVLRKVHVEKQSNFDRIVFEFSGDFVPVSRVGYARPPFNLGETDETVEIGGSAFLRIALMPAYAHEIRSGKQTVKDREKAAGLVAVKEIRRIYDHEGQVTYVIGLGEEKRFRVQVLSEPSRLVVDVNSH